MKALLFCIIMLGSYNNVKAFDPPTYGDPWYYQDNSRPMFWVPDKAQHYWGSYALSEMGQKYLGKNIGRITAFALGYLWEVKDSQTSLRNGVVGFSYRDLIADALGVISSVVNRKDNIKLWLSYSTEYEKIIVLNIRINL